MTLERVYLFGAGKVGSALHKGLRRAGVRASLRPRRRGWPKRVDAQLIVLSVRDEQIVEAAGGLARLADASRAPVVHCAGGLGPDALAFLRGSGHPVGLMHPLLAFASARRPPPFAGAFMCIAGDAPAVRRAREVARALGMRSGDFEGLDHASYHAAAALCANGAAALLGAAKDLLCHAGVPEARALELLTPLLSSVAHNAAALGLPDALTGPVRRGDRRAVAAHLARIGAAVPEIAPLYRALVRAQLPMARALAEAPLETFDDIGREIDAGKV